MIMRQVKTWILLATLSLLLPTTVSAQGSAEKQPSDSSAKQENSASKTDKKPVAAEHPDSARRGSLPLEIIRVSTEEAVRSTAQAEAKKRAAKDGSPAESPDAAVLEFKPADQDSARGAVVAPSKDSKKSALKRVHGAAYGSLNPDHPGNHEAAASVGATSKSGKSSIYVETDRSKATLPSPH